MQLVSQCLKKDFDNALQEVLHAFSYPEPFLRAVNGARRGALAKSISNWHLIGYNEGYCSNTGYILLPCFHGIRLWIWPEPLVAPRVRRALGNDFHATRNDRGQRHAKRLGRGATWRQILIKVKRVLGWANRNSPSYKHCETSCTKPCYTLQC